MQRKYKQNENKNHLTMPCCCSLLNSCQQPKTSEAKGESASITDEMDRTVLPIKEPTIPSTQRWMHAMQKRHLGLK